MLILNQATIREGSEQPIDFWFQLDVNLDGHPDTPIIMDNLQSLAVHLRPKMGENPEMVFATTDATPKLILVDPLGLTEAPNGALASHAQLHPGPTDFVLSDYGYDVYFMVVDSEGRQTAIPEDHNLQLFVFA